MSLPRPPRQASDGAVFHPTAQAWLQRTQSTVSKIDRAVVVDPTTDTVTASGTFSGALKPSTNSQTGAYVAVAGDAGKVISNTTGGLTINDAVFAAGDLFYFYNNSTGNQTITPGSGVTLRIANTATSGTVGRTVARNAMVMIYAVSATEFVLAGMNGGVT